MSIIVRCKCGNVFTARDSLVGRAVRCRNCDAYVQVLSAEESAALREGRDDAAAIREVLARQEALSSQETLSMQDLAERTRRQECSRSAKVTGLASSVLTPFALLYMGLSRILGGPSSSGMFLGVGVAVIPGLIGYALGWFAFSPARLFGSESVDERIRSTPVWRRVLIASTAWAVVTVSTLLVAWRVFGPWTDFIYVPNSSELLGAVLRTPNLGEYLFGNGTGSVSAWEMVFCIPLGLFAFAWGWLFTSPVPREQRRCDVAVIAGGLACATFFALAIQVTLSLRGMFLP